MGIWDKIFSEEKEGKLHRNFFEDED